MNDLFVTIMLIGFASMCYYMLHREKRHKEVLAFSKKQLMLYSFEPKALDEFKSVLEVLPLEQRLYLTHGLFGNGRPIKALMQIYESGVILDGLYCDDDKPDSKKEKGTGNYFG